ncbi:MAG: uroporphyrinogen decarboxylase family protein [Bacillota bacterium]|nr:uroporphyrinogen decarboxylase family protein [Bacillota bacterium]
MDGRERITNTVLGLNVDRKSWTLLIDEKTRQNMKSEYKNIPMTEFYRLCGCDIMQFGLWTSKYGYANPGRITFFDKKDIVTFENGITVSKRETPWGILESSSKDGHPLTYPIKNIHDLSVYMKLWKDSDVSYNPESAKLFSIEENNIGRDGLCVCTTMPSPVQMLLQTEMGVENFYYLLYDYTKEVEDLLDIMHEKRKQEYRINAEYSEQLIHIPVENTSTSYISPEIYMKYSSKHIKDYVDILHSTGKIVVVHMCGLLDNLLTCFLDTGMDGIHTLTPKPIGDTSIERAIQVMGRDTIIMALLDNSQFLRPDITREEIYGLLDKFYTQQVRSSRVILIIASDGIPTSVEKFMYVREWMDKNG